MPSNSWIQAITDFHPGNLLGISRITWVEVLSAFARRQREGSLTASDVAQSIQLFRHDIQNQYDVIEVSAGLTEMSGQLYQFRKVLLQS